MSEKRACLFCDKTDQEIPLLRLEYQDNTLWICPQHMPVLIHNPNQLEGKLPGAENMEAG